MKHSSILNGLMNLMMILALCHCQKQSTDFSKTQFQRQADLLLGNLVHTIQSAYVSPSTGRGVTTTSSSLPSVRSAPRSVEESIQLCLAISNALPKIPANYERSVMLAYRCAKQVWHHLNPVALQGFRDLSLLSQYRYGYSVSPSYEGMFGSHYFGNQYPPMNSFLNGGIFDD